MKGFSICSTLISVTAITGDYIIGGYGRRHTGVCRRCCTCLEWANDDIFKQTLLELKGIYCYNSYLLSLFCCVLVFVWCFYRTDGCGAPKQQWVLVALTTSASLRRGTSCFLLGHHTLWEEHDLVRAQLLNHCLTVHHRMLHPYEQLPFHNIVRMQPKHQKITLKV